MIHIHRDPIPDEIWDRINVGDLVELVEGIEKPPTPYPTPLPAWVKAKHTRKQDGAKYLTVQWANGTNSGWPEAWFKKAQR